MEAFNSQISFKTRLCATVCNCMMVCSGVLVQRENDKWQIRTLPLKSHHRIVYVGRDPQRLSSPTPLHKQGKKIETKGCSHLVAGKGCWAGSRGCCPQRFLGRISCRQARVGPCTACGSWHRSL